MYNIDTLLIYDYDDNYLLDDPKIDKEDYHKKWLEHHYAVGFILLAGFYIDGVRFQKQTLTNFRTEFSYKIDVLYNFESLTKESITITNSQGKQFQIAIQDNLVIPLHMFPFSTLEEDDEVTCDFVLLRNGLRKTDIYNIILLDAKYCIYRGDIYEISEANRLKQKDLCCNIF